MPLPVAISVTVVFPATDISIVVHERAFEASAEGNASAEPVFSPTPPPQA